MVEHAGIIKVRGSMVRYFAKMAFGGYYDQRWCEMPEVNDLQINRLCEYAKKYRHHGKLSFNNPYPEYTYAQLRQMDRIQINKLFEL